MAFIYVATETVGAAAINDCIFSICNFGLFEFNVSNDFFNLCHQFSTISRVYLPFCSYSSCHLNSKDLFCLYRSCTIYNLLIGYSFYSWIHHMTLQDNPILYFFLLVCQGYCVFYGFNIIFR